MVQGIGLTKEGSYTNMMDIINKKLKTSQKLRPSTEFYRGQAQGYGSYSVKGGQAGYIPYVPTMEGQYIIKNLMIISAALVVGGTVHRREKNSQ